MEFLDSHVKVRPSVSQRGGGRGEEEAVAFGADGETWSRFMFDWIRCSMEERVMSEVSGEGK